MSSNSHVLKLRDCFCDEVLMHNKTFEVRRNLRGFQKGDIITFQCVDEDGRALPHVINNMRFQILYVLSGWGIEPDYVVFSFKAVQ
ncbi:MAG: DUF3850 domain-containing protein [Lachnospiraceae bacterium]|nr:DUF3850 domain-containing protein [Lachnospiraceae bacterium]